MQTKGSAGWCNGCTVKAELFRQKDLPLPCKHFCWSSDLSISSFSFSVSSDFATISSAIIVSETGSMGSHSAFKSLLEANSGVSPIFWSRSFWWDSALELMLNGDSLPRVAFRFFCFGFWEAFFFVAALSLFFLGSFSPNGRRPGFFFSRLRWVSSCRLWSKDSACDTSLCPSNHLTEWLQTSTVKEIFSHVGSCAPITDSVYAFMKLENICLDVEIFGVLFVSRMKEISSASLNSTCINVCVIGLCNLTPRKQVVESWVKPLPKVMRAPAQIL